MTLTSADDSVSIFKDGKLKPGVYKIQNIVGQTYVDIREHTRELCGRPTTLLEGGGLGKKFRRVLDTPYTGYSVGSHFSSLCPRATPQTPVSSRRPETVPIHLLDILIGKTGQTSRGDHDGS
ncbi:hypothetical protein BDM02DRAFT_2342614 [Thelephora ganbajun]|uniref:Uncharacterized protein n=1 Tax=Thelephora ganbajun TaxID=370292 RepID=A0ACB6ZFP6_THEGA|nr:hypothetical protein BDM02DRAFT_2342614 [Thelephora ganbajun]